MMTSDPMESPTGGGRPLLLVSLIALVLILFLLGPWSRTGRPRRRSPGPHPAVRLVPSPPTRKAWERALASSSGELRESAVAEIGQPVQFELPTKSGHWILYTVHVKELKRWLGFGTIFVGENSIHARDTGAEEMSIGMNDHVASEGSSFGSDTETWTRAFEVLPDDRLHIIAIYRWTSTPAPHP